MYHLNIETIMNYLASLLQTISHHEKAVHTALNTFCNAEARGEDPVVRIGKKPVSYTELAKKFHLLHYSNPVLNKSAMLKPAHHEAAIKSTVLQKIELLRQLGLSYRQPPVEIRGWLYPPASQES